MDQVNERIRQLRRITKQTQRVFAGILGISRSHVANLEAGKVSPSEHLLLLICKQFGVNPQWLKHGKGFMTVPSEPLEPEQLEEIDSIVQEVKFESVAKYTEMFLSSHRIMSRHLVEALKDAKKLNPELCPFLVTDLLEEVLSIAEGEPFVSAKRMLRRWKPYTLPRAPQESEQEVFKQEHPGED